MKATTRGIDDRKQRWNDHLPLCRRGNEIHALAVFGLDTGDTFSEALDLSELAANLLHDGPCSLTNREHTERCKEIGDDPADQQADQDLGVGEVKAHGLAGQFLNCPGVLGEENQGCQGRGADCVSLGNCLGSVAHRVQRVGSVANFIRQIGHFGNTAGVVSNGTVRVDGNDHSGHGKHRHDRHRYAVKTGAGTTREATAKAVPDHDGYCEDDDGQDSGDHADGETGDDVGAVSGGAGVRHVFHRAVHSREVLGDDNDQTGKNQTEDRHPEDAERRNHEGCALKWCCRAVELWPQVKEYSSQNSGHGQTFVQRAHYVQVFLGLVLLNFTKKVPMMDAMIATPPMSRGIKNADDGVP